MDSKDDAVPSDDADIISQSEAVNNSENNSQNEPVSSDNADVVSQTEAVNNSENNSQNEPISSDNADVVSQTEAVNNSENNSQNEPVSPDNADVVSQTEAVNNVENNSQDEPVPSDTVVSQSEALSSFENNSQGDPVSSDDAGVISQLEALSNSGNNSQDNPVSLENAGVISQLDPLNNSENDSQEDPICSENATVSQSEALNNFENNSLDDPVSLDNAGVVSQLEAFSNFESNAQDDSISLDNTSIFQSEALNNSENKSQDEPVSSGDIGVISQPEAVSNSENNSKDPEFLDDTDVVSQPETVSNSENKDTTKSCIEEVSEENKESDQSQIDKDIAEVHNEIDKKETTITSEKDLTISNIEATASSETDEGHNNAELEAASENATITAKESNVVESSFEENASVHVDAETTELDTSILTEKCDTKLASTLEDLCKVPDDNLNDREKSVNDDVADESETLSKEKTKDCDIPDESSSNADDAQVSQKEAASKKMDTESSDSNLDNFEKDLSEKNVEPENTEFVQFSNDKQDDSQIEGQPMDAEDPFGGDTLTSENVEPMETDSLTESELREQGDNLQDAVNARNNDCSDELNVDSSLNDANSDVNKIVNNITETSNDVRPIIDSPDNTAMDTDLPASSTSKTGTGDISTKTSDEQEEQTKKDAEKITPMETDEQTDVLPGQDDELCIIPDSMKVIIPNKSGKTIDDDQNKSTPTKDSKSEEATQNSSKSSNLELEKDTLQNECKETIENKDKTESVTKQNATIQDETPLKQDVIVATDIINIDDEKNLEVEEISNKEVCKQCGEERACKIRVKINTETYFVCSKTCKALYKAANNKTIEIPSEGTNSNQEKRCAACLLIIEANDERNLSWETMEFCNEECLGKFQRKYGSFCKNCNGVVQAVSLGKYCVRFGCDVRQFCCSTCLEEFKKGLKVCSYCQKDISFSTDGFLAPVGEKGQFKDFCTQDCMEKYSKLNSLEPPTTEKKPCSVCKEEKVVHCEVQIYNSSPVAICSEPCFAAFKFVKQVKPEQCSTCKKFFELPNKQHFIVFYENEPHTFCNKTCLNIFIITNRKIVPCNWCKVKKYNFDMIKKELKTGQVLMMCSLNCLTLYQVSINAVSAKRINCDLCKEYSLAHYHLTMSDATIRNFCSYNCVMNFQAQYTKSPITIPSSDDPVPTGLPKKTTLPQRSTNQIIPNEIQSKKTLPIISSVTSLATIGNGQASPTTQQNNIVMAANANQTAQMVYKQQVIIRPPSPVKVHNKTTQCKPIVHTKGVSVRPHPCTKSTQTEEKVQQVVVPIPVPIYVPFPMHMYSMPFPVPMPFPLPIPVPLFIPTTRNSAKGIMKDIKKIQEKIPADPYEAELLMMAEMVATEKKADSDSDSVDDREDDTADQDNLHSDGFSPEAVDSSNTFGDDMLQMALKMATEELDEPAVDLEAALTPNTITATQAPPQPENTLDNDVQSERLMVSSRGRKRVLPYKPRSTPTKRMRRVSGTNDMPLMPPPEPQPPPQPRIMEPMEKPDANMALKYTFGVNAWRQWVVGKNAELEKQITPMRKIKLFKTDLLQLTADELNYSLCLFVKEVRKPNGAEYAPDTIYYLCLGIQQYLFENNRIDNIFTDSYYEKFTDCLNEVAKKFSVLYNEAQYIVTRVEEEHLWECKQLGAHSPHVLLSTLMFFNTKHFNLVTVEEHMQLSFSHIMKHWKRNPAAQPTAVTGKVPGSRNVLLRFYPPQSALANSRKKKVYEQQENEENPLRCPVKLYEFYLSKCPESVKTRNDVFYLLPERSCVPDSPVWYSTSPLAKEQLVKMLYRIKMVKEINVALLTS
ncbi:zinc finger MYM-type protein 3 isoform X2 [Solenopsis invicta]|uniref:zinc finger MYM-type protein 3 isoform X2 n=1 Tax=Solenopsis invicta TaxID=13686 RepID=UPI00193D344B|nr:zinc finger MYM-type protein 3 isoform X2 [Solenopsis invicta]